MKGISKIKTIIATTIVATSIGVISFVSQINLPKSVDVYDVKQEITLAEKQHHTELIYESEFGYRSLLPSALTAKKGIHIFGSDNLQYTRGSLLGGDGAGVVYENFDPHNGTAEFWVRTNFASTDTATHYILDASAAVLYWDGANTQWKATVNGINIVKADTFSAGDWTYIFLTWTNKTSDTLDLEVDGSSASQVTTAQTSGTPSAAIYIGQNSASANIFNGVIAGRILNNIITSNYAAGAGSLDSFTVTPSTVWLGTYSDSDDDAVFQHRGQSVSATTATVVTLGEAVGSRSWKDDDRVVVWDGTGYKVESAINDAGIETTDTTITVDSVAALANVGRSLDFNKLYQAVAANNTIHDITTEDIGISMWIREDSNAATTGMGLLTKSAVSGNGRWRLRTAAGVIAFTMTDDGGDAYDLTGNTDLRDNKWHQVGVIIDRDNAANCKIYVDGYEDGTTNKTGTLGDVGTITSTATLTLGAYNDYSLKFDGQIRDVILAYPADIMAAGEMGASGMILELATDPRDLTVGGTLNSEDSWALNDNAATTVVVGAVNNLTASANTNTFDSQEAFISKNLIADSGMENGGIGGWTAGDAASTLAKNTSVVKFDTKSLKITNADATQAFARQTITTVAGEDYRFHGWFRSPATPNGASQLVDVDGTAALGITVTQAGATAAATWYEIDFTFEAADTSTTIDLGTGSVTDTEIGYWDNVSVRKNLVNDGGVETWTSATDLTNWTEYISGTSTVNQETTTVHSGSNAVRFDIDASNSSAYIQQLVSVIDSKYYTVSVWAKANSGTPTVYIRDTFNSGSNTDRYFTLSTTWTKLSYTTKAIGTASRSLLFVRNAATSKSLYVDDVSLIELDQITPSTATKGDGHYPINYPQIQPF